MSVTPQRLREIGRERFGYASFHPGQEEAINSLLDHRDTLAVMPTGAGKSAIYQIAGLLLPGPGRPQRLPGAHLSLSHEERRITTMRRNLERYLGIPSEITGGEPSQAAGTSVES